MSLESNTYLDNFIPTVKEELTRLSDVTEDIEQERLGWINSDAAEQLALLQLQSFGVKTAQISPDQLRELIPFYQSTIFGTSDTKGIANTATNKILG